MLLMKIPHYLVTGHGEIKNGSDQEASLLLASFHSPRLVGTVGCCEKKGIGSFCQL